MLKSTMMKFTEHEIRHIAGSDVFLRGKEYFLERRVEHWEFKDGIVSASVRGGAHFPYQVKIYVLRKDKVHSDCTCPYDFGKMCKHAVAVLLTAVAQERANGNMNAAAIAKQPVLAKKSLLFSRDDHASMPPLLRLILPTRNNIATSSKGIKVDTVIVHKGQTTAVRNMAQLLAPDDYIYARNPNLPLIEEFNATQMQCLRLMHAFTDKYTGEFHLKPHELSLLLRESAGEGVEFLEGKNKPLRVLRDKKVPVTIEVMAASRDKMGVFFFTQHPDDPERKMEGYLIEGRPCWLINFNDGFILPFSDIFDEQMLLESFFVNSGIEVPKAEAPQFIHLVLNRVKDHARIIYRDKTLENIVCKESSLKVELYLEGSIKRLTVSIHFDYGDQKFSLQDLLYAPPYLFVQEQMVWLKRDIAKEREIIIFLCDECGFYLDGEKQLAMTDQDDIATFVFDKIPKITQQYAVFYAPGFEDKFNTANMLRPTVSFGANELDWFYFDIKYAAKGVSQEFSQEEIRKQLMRGKNYVRLKNGDIIPISRDEFNKAERLSEEFDGKSNKLPIFHVPFALEEAERQHLKIDVLNGKFNELHERFKQFRSIKKIKPPDNIKEILRDYQQKGLDWLEFLRGFHFGGILADEMGLGKTLQVLALIKLQVDAGEKLPNLVVCPTTLTWNWQAEIEKFMPDLKVLVPHGNDRREQISGISDYHVVVTSYALLRRDAKLYDKFRFNYVILDEAQNIKNRHTLNARMSKQLKSRHRLVMTGTPMENSVADLWSIFDFLMPGFLGGYERFKFRYETPILNDQNKEALDALARKIKPFMLRRLKKEVIKELPEKMEQVSFCELEPTQAKVYAQMLALARKEVMDAYQAQGFNKSRMKILTIILRLRQICCHPHLAHVALGHRLSVSAKLNLLKEIVQESLSGGHKILIFSQFIGMLTIISEYLNKEKIAFEYMDGSTTDRAGSVERFNTSPNTKIFLLSLKVGGVGLNLTSADTVIMYEPWWNPAVEDQAIDRAHRFGQKNTVIAYKLICKGTIEEKILELQHRKKNIIDSLVVSEEGIAKKLGWDDIKFMLDID